MCQGDRRFKSTASAARLGGLRAGREERRPGDSRAAVLGPEGEGLEDFLGRATLDGAVDQCLELFLGLAGGRLLLPAQLLLLATQGLLLTAELLLFTAQLLLLAAKVVHLALEVRFFALEIAVVRIAAAADPVGGEGPLLGSQGSLLG